MAGLDATPSPLFGGDPALHARFTNLAFVHHLLGNGDLQAVIQVTEDEAAGNALVLHLMNPDRYRPKTMALTYHQQVGPEWTAVALRTGDDLYLPNPRQTASDLRYTLTFSDDVAQFEVSWPAEFGLACDRQRTPFVVEERFFLPAMGAVLWRQVRVHHSRGLLPQAAALCAVLVTNEQLMPQTQYDAAGGMAFSGGTEGETLLLCATRPPDRVSVGAFPQPLQEALAGGAATAHASGDCAMLQYDLGMMAPGESRSLDLLYVYGDSAARARQTAAAAVASGSAAARSESRKYWRASNCFHSQLPQMNRFYTAMRSGVRAAAGRTGSVNAGIWGFNDEWVRDSSLFCVGAVLSGQFVLARAILDHLIANRFNDEGIAFGESQFYDPDHHEPDQNGELFYALWLYWVHARDDALIRRHWPRLVSIAEFPIGVRFWDDAAHMIRSQRDIRERDKERHGLEEGYELAYQMWVSLGLQKAADMAHYIGDDALAARWHDIAEQMWHAALHHPRFCLVEDGYLMKRRLPDGRFQRVARTKPYIHRVRDDVVQLYPRNLACGGELEPDHSESYPIALGMIDPHSPLAQRTLQRMEQLWNQEWDFGGYPLQHAGSEPTKLGAHTLPWQTITQAALLGGHLDTVRRNLDYYLSTAEGRGYTWWEYRDADPELQIDHGITPWFIFAEPVKMFMHDIVGYRPQPDGILFQPHLLPEWGDVEARLRFGKHMLSVKIHNGGRVLHAATLNGLPIAVANGVLRLPVLTAEAAVEIWLKE